jgi:lipoyl(octanoyl) transferase
MDMSPWQRINPCGLGVVMTQVADLVNPSPDTKVVSEKLAGYLTLGLGYNDYSIGKILPHVSD